MKEFISVFQKRQDVLLETTWEHLQISLLSLVIAIVIAVPLGLILTRYRRIAEPVIGASAVMQTIPSLAVLAFLIPFIGIGKTPAIIALTAYGLLPILRNTYIGIKEVNPALKEAATGMGMNSFKMLTKVELPLATPVIMAGIRTSMVLIVGDRKSTRLNSSHVAISYAVFCLKKKILNTSITPKLAVPMMENRTIKKNKVI